MFPKWFDKWNRDNPTNIFGPAVAIGTVGGAVFVAALLVTWGQPYATESLQTGPRGTGMSVPEFKVDLAKPDPSIESFLASTSAPVVPQGGEQTAGQARQNVPPGLEGLTVENYDRLLAAMRVWTGIPDLFESPDNYQTAVGHVMIGMTQNLNEEWSGHVNANKEVGVTCYTCHRGQPVPSDVWFKISPVNETVEGWSANQNRVTVQSQYTSLPSDALEKYLLDGESIKVHDLESRVAGVPGTDGYPGIQQAERTYSLMNYVSNSLGVNCVFCHNSRAFYDGSQVTPQWGTEILGIEMVLELNNTYLVPLEGLLPEERLGPVYADAPKAACKTCHKGYQQPLQGTNVIGDWPELATTSGEPDYSN
ncbi:MAG: photosynthetic reaction center cytochrome c subunit [Roseovarius sp.]|uniref:photosynthetic reaction center cytochrome PufC n=1 Tax=Roseovarius sp. TaxID=1486281 RepID=UPI001B6D0336|nr:photosynthetic reaction center cytochrome PufC [Roseovarius sp.]MBQ0750391.1 photosynthetic reaction center cytochrome c subunit [Roseovarius sp.]MBQ0811448.1 photosynthetic reaction center cytochrome c subunit [Roseovarius sp.]